MNELDKMARELLAAEYERHGHTLRAAECLGGRNDLIRSEQALHVIRTALLTAPPGWKLVPIPPADEMIDAANDAHMPFGDMHFAITSAILAAPEPK